MDALYMEIIVGWLRYRVAAISRTHHSRYIAGIAVEQWPLRIAH
jgi:hypothetical protein